MDASKFYLWLNTKWAPLLLTRSIPCGVPAVPTTVIPTTKKKPGHKRKIERPPMNNHRSINSKFLSWLQRAISLILHQSVEFNAIHLRSTIMRTFIRQTIQWQINRRKTNFITKNSPLKSVRSIETWNIAIIDTDSVMNKVSIIESNYSIKLSYSPLISSTINW